MVWANTTPKRYTSSLTSPIPAAAMSCCSLNHETGHRSLSCVPCKLYHGHFEAAGNCKTLWSRSLDCGTCQCRECCWMQSSTISDKSEKLYTYKVASWTFSNGYIYIFITQKRSFKPKGTQVSQIGRQDMLPQLETKLYSRFIRFTAPHETSVSRGKAGHPEIKIFRVGAQ